MFDNTIPKEGSIEFYSSTKWKKCRRNYLSIHPVCERCEKMGRITRAKLVHHKIPLDTDSYKDPELSLNYDNLEALCYDCHHAEHYGKKECKDGLYFDADGNLQKG